MSLISSNRYYADDFIGEHFITKPQKNQNIVIINENKVCSIVYPLWPAVPSNFTEATSSWQYLSRLQVESFVKTIWCLGYYSEVWKKIYSKMYYSMLIL